MVWDGGRVAGGPSATEDPEELTKMMKGMAEGMPEEACKQQ